MRINSPVALVAGLALAGLCGVSPLRAQHSPKKKAVSVWRDMRRESRPISSKTYSRVVEERAIMGGQPRDSAYSGGFEIDMPDNVELGKPFDLDIRLRPYPNAPRGSVAVRMEQTDRVQYEPRVFSLRPGTVKTIRATVRKTNSGLAGIIANADGWLTYERSVSVGFPTLLEPASVAASFSKGGVEPLLLAFVDKDSKKRVSLDGPVFMIINSARASVRELGNSQWASMVKLEVPAGEDASPVLELRPEGNSGEKATVWAKVALTSGHVIHSQAIEFPIYPRWWQALLMSVLGGAIWGLRKAGWPQGNRDAWRRHFAKCMGAAVLAGGIGYCLSSRDLLGLKLDSTTLKGYFLLGFAFSCVGVDAALRLWMPGKPPAL